MEFTDRLVKQFIVDPGSKVDLKDFVTDWTDTDEAKELGREVIKERALEILSIAAPDSRYVPDGQILRGNLLLRGGRYDEANTIFRGIAREFDALLDDFSAAAV